MGDIEIIEATSEAQLETVRELVAEYARFLENDHGFDIGYQAVPAELAGLPGDYAPPAGRLWLALADSVSPAGCAALRPIDELTCELKRMYVRPAFRRLGIGRALALRAIESAEAIGYRAIRLDTATFLPVANRLYAELGFREIEPYYPVPHAALERTVYLERVLRDDEAASSDGQSAGSNE